MDLTIKEVVEKLIGNINPIGDTTQDTIRFGNLKNTCDLVDELISDIAHVANRKSSEEYSVKKAAEYASKRIKSFSDI